MGIMNSVNKASSRLSYGRDNFKINVSINRLLYICAHESAADLSLLSDFDKFKNDLCILRRYYVTRGSPIVSEK